MPELISSSRPKARKTHKCQLCNKSIAIGEVYRKQFLKYDGQAYDFKEHDRCGEIASYLWNYIDPDEGMTDEHFQEGCQAYCSQFICPMCVHLIDEDCEDGQNYCLDKIATHLKKYGLKKEPGKYGIPHWVEFEREEADSIAQKES